MPGHRSVLILLALVFAVLAVVADVASADLLLSPIGWVAAALVAWFAAHLVE